MPYSLIVTQVRSAKNSVYIQFLRAKAAYIYTAFSASLAIAILSIRLSVRLSVTRVDQSKAVQARITKSLPSVGFRNLKAFQ